MIDRDEWFFRIKTATRTLVKLIGTYEDAGRICGVSAKTMHRYGQVAPDNSDIIPIMSALKLEAECGVPCVTEAMAARNGLTLQRSDGTASPACMMTAFGGVADDFGELAVRVAAALGDGTISPNELTSIDSALSGLSEAVTRAKGTSAKLRAVGDAR